MGTFAATADCGRHVVFGISFQNYFDHYFSVFVPARSRAGTKAMPEENFRTNLKATLCV
jgi:hypothetical protein